mmetsp:Transcript_3780/g.4353  ORF Transcript_3780/g.4353 Transcript_3780/m.4353 type:complete len:109 (+) Transcript_3780:85-411(+)
MASATTAVIPTTSSLSQIPADAVSVVSTEGSVRDELDLVSQTIGVVPMNDGAKQQAVSSTASQASSLKEEMKPKKDTWASRTFAPGSPFTATIAVIKATLGGAILSNT